MHNVLLRLFMHNQLLLNMNQVPVLTIKMVPAGVELVLKALGKLPIEEAGPLFQEIKGQAEYQLQALNQAAETAQAPAATNPSPEAEQAPSAPADPVPATVKQGD